LSGIPAKDAIAAVVAAEIGKREKDLSRVSNDAGFKALLGSAGCGQ
jgi:hypothetical protein